MGRKGEVRMLFRVAYKNYRLVCTLLIPCYDSYSLQDLSEGRGGGGFKTTILQKSRNRYVILDFKLLNWKYMNFTKQFDENTYVFAVKVCRLDCNAKCACGIDT
jgi:hypothetical protein